MRTNSSMPAAAAIAILAMLVMISPARADGKYFRQSNVLAEPEIPSQRAIITFRDGVQTLIVESTVKGQGESLGWVLPLPAEPISIEPCSAGTIRSMAALVQPEIKGDQLGKEWVQGSLTVLLIVIISCFTGTIARRKGASLLAVTLMVLLVLIIIGSMLPALSAARAGRSIAGVNVVESKQVGSYDVTVIQDDSAKAVEQWLSENGFQFESAASKELARYVAEKWCFAVAKIRNDGDREHSPHPLKVQVPIAKPVYPMRLTGLTETPLQLDLYIIAEQRASTDHMATWHCDQFEPGKRKNHYNFEQLVYVGNDYGYTIGHPDLVALMWPDCVLTSLHGRLTPEQMKQDMTIECGGGSDSKRHTIYSHRAALGMSVGIAMLVAAGCVIVLTIARQNDLRRTIKGAHVGAGAFALCAIGSVVYFTCDVQAITSSAEHRWRSMRWVNEVAEGLLELKEHAPIAEFEAAFAKTRVARYGDILDRWKMDIPLGYQVEKSEEGWNVTIYDRYAIPSRAAINRQGEMTALP